MSEFTRLAKFDGEYTLSFDCDTPVDDVVRATGDEPSGHFWECVAEFVAPKAFAKVEPDSEGSMFSVSGKRRHLRSLQKEMEPIVTDPHRLREVLAAAKSANFRIEA